MAHPGRPQKCDPKVDNLRSDIRSGNYDIATSFGEFKNKTAFAIKEDGKDDDDDRHGPKFNHKYSGTSGSGSTKVKIKSSFGEIIMGHDLVVDMSETKHKGRTRTI